MNNLITLLKYSFSIYFLFIIAACSDHDTKNSGQKTLDDVGNFQSKGFQMTDNSCFICHNPNPSALNRIAPTMAEIRKGYMGDGITKENFVQAVTTYVLGPDEKLSKLPDATKKYGIMPKMNFSGADLAIISGYIFETDFNAPDWYEKSYLVEKQKPQAIDTSQSYEAQGLNFALATKAVLGKNLMMAIKTQGVENAISFCNSRAYVITDSMSAVLGAKIRRVSDHNRNENNVANASELAYIKEGRQQIMKGEKPKPRLIEEEGKITGYYPIITDKLCLQCHGEKGKDIKQSTLAKITQHYPKDQGTGYKEGDIRGIWVIEMEKK